MITFSKLGSYGNLGNQLFQIASLMGLGKWFNHKVVIPNWQYAEYFEGLPEQINITGKVINEVNYHYDLNQFKELYNDGNYDILGWLQSEGYFYERLFTLKGIQKNNKIGISVRRGDYVDNPNYVLLEINYYLNALIKLGIEREVNIYTDDFEYCKIHFEGLPNVTFIQGSPIEQLISMASCQDVIMANSTFSWWGAYLGDCNVIRPNALFAGKLLENNDEDFYPKRWIIQDHKQKIDLKDTTFIIPVKYDHPHREENMLLCIEFLQKYFDTNIIVGEMGSHFKYLENNVRRVEFDLKYFHRTKMLNELTCLAETPYVINYDADVFISPVQLFLAIDKLRKGVDFVYPYDGRFARVPRTEINTIYKYKDVGQLKKEYVGTRKQDFLSVGGAIAYNKKSFIDAGGENENFISYGAEDLERKYRFETLGYKVERIKGKLFHLDHYISLDSSNTHPHFKANQNEWQKVQKMSKAELQEYISNWNNNKSNLKLNTNKLVNLVNQKSIKMLKPNPQYFGVKVIGANTVITINNKTTQQELEYIASLPKYAHLVIAEAEIKKNEQPKSETLTPSTISTLTEQPKEEKHLRKTRQKKS
jgi:hypothetical protein